MEAQRFSSFDGTGIAYRDLGERRGAPTLLLHGFASDSVINWVRPGVAGALVEAGRRVVLIDARGHGESDKPHEPERYRGGAMVEDARALLDHLGVEEVDVVGYSMGSLVAVRLGSSDARVRSLALGGAGTGQVEMDSRARALRIAEALEAPEISAVTDPTGLAFRNFADATHADRIALAAIQRASSGTPSPDTLSSIDVPTLVVNGENDTLVGPLDSLARAIPGARFATVPGDHISAVVKPEFARAILDFLDFLDVLDDAPGGAL
jgi:pimeloyl-ACP methyl ester carboxylesterase